MLGVEVTEQDNGRKGREIGVGHIRDGGQQSLPEK